jgi:hypothetical protein
MRRTFALMALAAGLAFGFAPKADAQLAVTIGNPYTGQGVTLGNGGIYTNPGYGYGNYAYSPYNYGYGTTYSSGYNGYVQRPYGTTYYSSGYAGYASPYGWNAYGNPGGIYRSYGYGGMNYGGYRVRRGWGGGWR